jgi:hypothetical protein
VDQGRLEDEMKAPKEDKREALREAFLAYQTAVLAETSARSALSATKAAVAGRAAEADDFIVHRTAHVALLTAIGTRAGALVALDEAIKSRGGADK